MRVATVVLTTRPEDSPGGLGAVQNEYSDSRCGEGRDRHGVWTTTITAATNQQKRSLQRSGCSRRSGAPSAAAARPRSVPRRYAPLRGGRHQSVFVPLLLGPPPGGIVWVAFHPSPIVRIGVSGARVIPSATPSTGTRLSRRRSGWTAPRLPTTRRGTAPTQGVSAEDVAATGSKEEGCTVQEMENFELICDVISTYL